MLIKSLKTDRQRERYAMKGESVESVIHSLLSSPSNFTPLLHFIAPIDDGQSKAFGEMWINPDEDNGASSKISPEIVKEQFICFWYSIFRISEDLKQSFM